VAAGRAAEAREASGEQAAGGVAAELLLDEGGVAGAAVAPAAGVVEQGLEVVADDPVERGLLGFPAAVGPGSRKGGCPGVRS